ncbi:MAG TPA: methylated-DNA--[protein]-cysteine S-methyltransferase [Pedococcus sp.]
MTDPEKLLGGFSPPVRPPELPATDVSYVVEDTAVGRMLLAADSTGALVASTFVPDDAAESRVLERVSAAVSPRVLRRPHDLDEARRELEAFLAGRSHRFTVRTDLALATPFQAVVLPRLAATVTYGHTATYGELARAVERPSASRAVGAALGANPLCVVLPCHRVVASSGALTGYAGGLAAKRYLLDLEAREGAGSA